MVVYKVDRLTRSLANFAKIVEQFDKQGISFVSVTQQFNTTTSMGRLTLNVLLSFAQFEREVTILKSIVSRIIIQKQEIVISLSRRALLEALLSPQEVESLAQVSLDDSILLKVGADLMRCKSEIRFLLSPDAPGSKAHPVLSLRSRYKKEKPFALASVFLARPTVARTKGRKPVLGRHLVHVCSSIGQSRCHA